MAPYLDGYGAGGWNAVADLLHPAGFAPATLQAAQVELDASWLPVGDPTGTVSIATRLIGPDGPTDVTFGPVSPGRHTYRAPTPSCAAGCRLASVTLSSTVGRPAAGSGLTVHAVSGLTPGQLLDRGRWRASVTTGAQVPQLAAASDGLSIVLGRGVPADASDLSVTAYVVDAPTPLPVLRAGGTVLNASDPRTAVLGNDVVPVRVAGQGRSLPEIRTGLLVDLEYADRLSSRPQQPTMQVWLAATAPPGLTSDLEAAGLTVLSESSIDGRRSALESRGSAAALRFMLAVAVVALGLVLLSFAIAAAAELRPWAADLGALRRQGLAGPVVRRAAIAGYLAAAVVAVGLGLLTGLVLRLSLPAALPIFADGWSDVDAPAASPVLAVGLAVTVAAAVRRGRRGRGRRAARPDPPPDRGGAVVGLTLALLRAHRGPGADRLPAGPAGRRRGGSGAGLRGPGRAGHRHRRHRRVAEQPTHDHRHRRRAGEGRRRPRSRRRWSRTAGGVTSSMSRRRCSPRPDSAPRSRWPSRRSC